MIYWKGQLILLPCAISCLKMGTSQLVLSSFLPTKKNSSSLGSHPSFILNQFKFEALSHQGKTCISLCPVQFSQTKIVLPFSSGCWLSFIVTMLQHLICAQHLHKLSNITPTNLQSNQSTRLLIMGIRLPVQAILFTVYWATMVPLTIRTQQVTKKLTAMKVTTAQPTQIKLL